MALGDDGGVERPGQADRDPVVRLAHLGRIAALDPQDFRTLDQPLGPQEPDRELVLESGRAHRDRDRHRLLPGPGRPDLERLLADDAVGAVFQFGAADGDDPGRRDVAGRREEIGHDGQSSDASFGDGRRQRIDPGRTGLPRRSAIGGPRDDGSRWPAATRPDLLRVRRRGRATADLVAAGREAQARRRSARPGASSRHRGQP